MLLLDAFCLVSLDLRHFTYVIVFFLYVFASAAANLLLCYFFMSDPCDFTTHGLVVSIHGADFAIDMQVYLLLTTSRISTHVIVGPLPVLPLLFFCDVTT